MGFKCKFPLTFWGPVPGSSQESVSRARVLGVVSGDSRFLLTLKMPKCPASLCTITEHVST